MKNKDLQKPPSDMFVDAVDGGIGSSDMVCDGCGRHHLCPDARYDSDEETDKVTWAEYCQAEYNEDPENVILHYDYDSVSGRFIDGRTFVVGCPCNQLSRYESWIWEHRNTIRNYLKVRIEQEHQWAEEELTKNKLAGI